MTKQNLFLSRSFFMLCGLEGLAAFLWLLSIPSDPKNAVLLGYSLERIGLMAAAMLIACPALVLYAKSGGDRGARISNSLDRWFGSSLAFWGALGLLILFIIGGFFGLQTYQAARGSAAEASLERLTPLVLLLGAINLQAALLLVLPRSGPVLRGLGAAISGRIAAWQRMPRKEKVFSLITIGLTIILTFGSLEIGLRLMRPQPTYAQIRELVGGRYAASEHIPFSLKPNHVSTSQSQEYPGEGVTISINSVGLRGEEISLGKPEGVQRILILGDSYTFGVYVENDETYAAVLQRLFEEESRAVEVLNAGYADGWEPDEHYTWLVNEGLKFEPDLIVYGFFVGNDISGLHSEYWAETDERGLPTKIVDERYYVDELGYLRSSEENPYGAGFALIYQIPVLRESHALIFLSNALQNLFSRLVPEERDDYGHFPFILRAESDAFMLEQERLFLQLVEGMDQVAEQNGADFLVLMIPANFQVEPDFLPIVYGPRYRVQRNYFEEVKPVFDEMGIPYLDMLQAMHETSGQYYPRNGEVHFNPSGHRFTAEELKRYLDEWGEP